MAQVPGTSAYSPHATQSAAKIKQFAFNFKPARNFPITPAPSDVRQGVEYADGVRKVIGTYTPPAGGGGGSYWS